MELYNLMFCIQFDASFVVFNQTQRIIDHCNVRFMDTASMLVKNVILGWPYENNTLVAVWDLEKDASILNYFADHVYT